MREPAVRPRRGDLARLVEVTGRPDAERLSERSHEPRRPSSDPRRRLREPQHQRAEDEPERHAQPREPRQRTARLTDIARGSAAASRRSTAATTSSTSMSSRHMRSQPAAAQVMALADAVARHA